MSFKDKKVLMRVELNVPLTKTGKISDDTRILSTLPSIKKILKENPKQLILMFHLGRPKDREKILQTDVVAKKLEELLNRKVEKVNHCGEEPITSKNKIIVLENLRFYDGEKKGTLAFAKQLKNIADVYVNESFGTCHRKDSSMYVVPKLFGKDKIFLGDLVKTEVSKLKLVEDSAKKKELTVIVGFAKISDKIMFLEKLLKKSNKVLVGGLVVFTFLKAKGLNIGRVTVDESEVAYAKTLLTKYSKKLVFPIDFKGLDGNNKLKTSSFDNIPSDFIGYDLGNKSIELFCKELDTSKVVLWNGPLGYFEKKPFDNATNKVSEFLSKNSKKINTIIGGGDTASAVKKSGFSEKLFHISTGGGASLEFIEKGTLPALKFFK